MEERPPAIPAPEGEGTAPGKSFGGESPPRGRLFVVGAAAVSVLLIATLDYATGPGISLILFYLVPIALAAWFAGDEFAILLPETGSVAAEAVIRKVQGTVDDLLREGRWDVTMSVGLLTCGSPPDSYDQALRQADALMYRAKSEGKNRVCHEVF